MSSFWHILCTLVCGIEGITGLVLTLFLIYILMQNRAGYFRSYRTCIIINAAQLSFNCVLIISGLWTHILSDEFFISIVYGPIKYAPKLFRDIVTSLAVIMVFSLYQFIAAPCIVQYLVLFRNTMSDSRRLGIAYLFTVYSTILATPNFWLFVPYPEITSTMENIARKVQRLGDDDDFVVYGIGLRADPANGNRTVYGLAFYSLAPTYSLTFVTFGFAVFKIVQQLGKVNNEMSIKTLELQKRFIKIQLIQGFVPLAILAIPFTTFMYFILTQANLDNLTLMLTFTLWSIPAIQNYGDKSPHMCDAENCITLCFHEIIAMLFMIFNA